MATWVPDLVKENTDRHDPIIEIILYVYIAISQRQLPTPLKETFVCQGEGEGGSGEYRV